MKIDLGRITNKFYRDDEIPLKMRATEHLMIELQSQIGDLLAQLHIKGYRFYCFHMDPERETMHAALMYCCGNLAKHAVDARLRREIIDPIIQTRTRYKKIVWEDLLQIGEHY